jgi:precorrin-6B methylase 2
MPAVQGVCSKLGLQLGIFTTLSMNLDRFGVDNAFVLNGEGPETGDRES